MTFKQENLLPDEELLANIKYFDTEIKTNTIILSLTSFLSASTCNRTKLSEYTEECLKNNCLNKGKQEWTTSTKYEEKYIDEETEEEIVPENNTVYSVGNKIELTNINTKLSIRPVVTLSSRTFLVSGEGTFERPFVIK